MTIVELIFLTPPSDSGFNVIVEIESEHALDLLNWTGVGAFGSPFQFYQAKIQASTFDYLIDQLIERVNAVPDERLVDHRKLPTFILTKKIPWSMCEGKFGQYKLLGVCERVICASDQMIVTLTKNGEICTTSRGHSILTLAEVLPKLENLRVEENAIFREHYEEMMSFVLSIAH